LNYVQCRKQVRRKSSEAQARHFGGESGNFRSPKKKGHKSKKKIPGLTKGGGTQIGETSNYGRGNKEGESAEKEKKTKKKTIGRGGNIVDCDSDR